VKVVAVGDELSLTIANRLEELEAVATRIDAFCATHRISSDIAYALNLSLDEVLTNVISYAYTGTREHQIDVRVRRAHGIVVAEVEDDGHPFNPLDVPPPDLDAPIEERPIGGLGLHIVRAMMDRVEYRRQGDHNVLTLTKNTR
jgi:serine/threonine-protein kinase RsbW